MTSNQIFLFSDCCIVAESLIGCKERNIRFVFQVGLPILWFCTRPTYGTFTKSLFHLLLPRYLLHTRVCFLAKV